ncbi:RING finger ubiquitin ligase-like protein [Xylogone sp. PMI_703]|nr:RING finger ubiquitin ligase-like protein [Xylogone sp. PMI_703]
MPPPPPQEYARLFMVIVFLIYIYSTPTTTIPPGFQNPRDFLEERVNRTRHALDVLNTTRWGDFSPPQQGIKDYNGARYLNLTGFREDDEFAWDRLDQFKKKSMKMSRDAKGNWRGKPEDDDTGLVARVWENVTGIVQGTWVRDTEGEVMRHRVNLTAVAPGVEWAIWDDGPWSRNVTGREGKLTLRVDEKSGEHMDIYDDLIEGHSMARWLTSSIREASATMTIQDDSSGGDGWEMRLHGVHWPRQGAILMTTTSEKFSGIFGLPHLSTSADYFTTGKKLLNITLGKAVEKLQHAAWIDQLNPWTSNPDAPGDVTMPIPHCEYVVYVQVHPLKMRVSGGGVHLIEQELRFPEGAPLPAIPKLQMSAVIYSPDCGFLLESKGPPRFSPIDGKHLVGLKEEVFLRGIQHWLLILAAVLFGQILLMKAQMKDASTPSTIGRISLYSMGIMVMADALLFACLSLLSATVPNIFPSALIGSFAALLSVALLVRFTGELYKAQEPERRERLRAEEAARAANRPSQPTPSSVPILTAAGALAPNAPASGNTPIAPPPATNIPVIIPSDQDIDAEIAEVAAATAPTPASLPAPVTALNQTTTTQTSSSDFTSIYGRFVLALTFILFLSLSSFSWPSSLRTGYVYTLSFLYLSFWIPQIRRNIIRNCRKALLWKFVIGQSVLRLLPFAYFFLKRDNILFVETDWQAFTFLAAWVWIQIWIMAAQEILGPRWGIPKGWTEEGWDYHPILREDNVEGGGLPLGLVQAPGSPALGRTRTGDKKKDAGVRSVDCAICMQVLEVPVVASGEDSAAAAASVTNMLARRQYMVTPCRHIFHSHCLEGWMRFRLQCPICREQLPPL